MAYDATLGYDPEWQSLGTDNYGYYLGKNQGNLGLSVSDWNNRTPSDQASQIDNARSAAWVNARLGAPNINQQGQSVLDSWQTANLGPNGFGGTSYLTPESVSAQLTAYNAAQNGTHVFDTQLDPASAALYGVNTLRTTPFTASPTPTSVPSITNTGNTGYTGTTAKAASVNPDDKYWNNGNFDNVGVSTDTNLQLQPGYVGTTPKTVPTSSYQPGVVNSGYQSNFKNTTNGLNGQMANAYSTALAGGVNPYLQQQAGALTQSSNQNLLQNILPQINHGATASGNYGGSRQGVAQGVAIGNAQTGLNQAIANMYGQGFENAANRQIGAATNLGGLGASMYNNELNNATQQDWNAFQMQNTGALTSDLLQTNAINRSLIQPTWDLNAQLGIGNFYNNAAGTGGTSSVPYTQNDFGNFLGGAATTAKLYQTIFG